MMSISPNDKTIWVQVKKMLDEGKTEKEVIQYLCSFLDSVIAMNDLVTPLQPSKRKVKIEEK